MSLTDITDMLWTKAAANHRHEYRGPQGASNHRLRTTDVNNYI